MICPKKARKAAKQFLCLPMPSQGIYKLFPKQVDDIYKEDTMF